MDHSLRHVAVHVVLLYSASKFAVVGFCEALQAELFRFNLDGVKVSFVCPMGVNTNLITGVADRAEFRDR